MITTLFLIIISFSLFVNLVYLVFTVLFRKSRVNTVLTGAGLPRVTILKPIKHGDDDLPRNFESFYLLDYPDYEIVFGVDTLDEPIVAAINELKKRFPGVATKIAAVGKEKFLNPKVEALALMEKEATGDLLWVSDANTRVERETLSALVHEYQLSGSKIVYSPINGMGAKTFGSIMENSYLNFYVAGNIISGWKVLKEALIVGKSMLIEKKALDGFGGFSFFREFLAEDYMMGQIFKKNRYYISTNLTWVTNFNSHSTPKRFASRISRWSKMRFNVSPVFYVGELLTNSTGLGIIAFFATGLNYIEFLVFPAAIKILLEYLNFIAVNRLDRKKAWIHLTFPLSIFIKDVILLGIYFVPFFNSRVNWRGKHIVMGKESRIRIEP